MELFFITTVTISLSSFLGLWLLAIVIFITRTLFRNVGNFDHVIVSVFFDFPSNSQWDAPFHCIAYDYSRADWDGLCDHLKDIPWEDIFKLGASAAANEFCEMV